MNLKVYAASSWRNPRYSSVVSELKKHFDVYDFQNPWDKGAAFNWDQIDPTWNGGPEMAVSAESFMHGISHPIAKRGFSSDFDGMKWADVCVLILPCGKSAHMEAGWFAGANKPLYILLEPYIRPELTYSLGRNCGSLLALIERMKVEAHPG